MSALQPTTLQINLSPADHRYAGATLPHQLRFWQQHVQEVLLVVDENRPRGRFAEGWDDGREALKTILLSLNGVRVLTVDYSPQAMHAVAKRFFASRTIPKKDYRGGPYYAYFFGLHAATHDHVLHCDADMLFGGNGAQWLPEALKILNQPNGVAFIAPLPGPPSREGGFRQLTADPVTIAYSTGYVFKEMSTRVFLFNRAQFCREAGPLNPESPGIRQRLLACLDGNPPFDLPERVITRAMQRHALKRFDFAGSSSGCWTLHPPYRCRDFYEKLPSIIDRVERNDLPAAQLGDHDINASLVDWSEAIAAMKQRRWWHRLGQRITPSYR